MRRSTKPKSRYSRKPKGKKTSKYLGRPKKTAKKEAGKRETGLKTIVRLETIRNEEFSDLVEALRYHPGSEALAAPVRNQTMDVISLLIEEGVMERERLERYRREHKHGKRNERR